MLFILYTSLVVRLIRTHGCRARARLVSASAYFIFQLINFIKCAPSVQPMVEPTGWICYFLFYLCYISERVHVCVCVSVRRFGLKRFRSCTMYIKMNMRMYYMSNAYAVSYSNMHGRLCIACGEQCSCQTRYNKISNRIT